MTHQMNAVGFYRHLPISHPESFLDLELSISEATGYDLLVQVKAISVNPVDCKIRGSKAKANTAPRILGWDVAGTVVACGANCSLFTPGDDVYYAGDLTRTGGNSAFHLVDERIVGQKPQTLTFAEAAALPLTTITAYEALFQRLNMPEDAEINKGKTILIIGASGGVGSIATQLANFVGLTVIGTASRPETSQWAKRHGATDIINHHGPLDLQLEQLGYLYVDYILCLHETESHWQNMVKAIAPQGKICAIVETTKPLDITALQRKSVTFVWEFMFTKSLYQTTDMIKQHELLNRVAQWLDQGLIQTTLNKTLSPINADNLRIAHEWVETGQAIGKVVLQEFEN